MLRKMCQRGLLAGFARNAISNEGILGKAMSIILGEKEESYTGRIGKQNQQIQEEDYKRVFGYWNQRYPSNPLHHHNQVPVPLSALLLGLTVDYIREIQHKGRIYSDFSMHAGNSSITYWVNEKRLGYNGGFIQQMWNMQVGTEQRTFISGRIRGSLGRTGPGCRSRTNADISIARSSIPLRKVLKTLSSSS
jgi:hypothetical protein